MRFFPDGATAGLRQEIPIHAHENRLRQLLDRTGKTCGVNWVVQRQRYFAHGGSLGNQAFLRSVGGCLGMGTDRTTGNDAGNVVRDGRRGLGGGETYLVCSRHGVASKAEEYLAGYMEANTHMGNLDLYWILKAARQIESILGDTIRFREVAASIA